MDKHERIVRELTKALKEVEQRENLAEVYARYSNRLAVESDCGRSEEEHEVLLEIVSHLKSKIVSDFMKQNGYFVNSNDDWKRWEKER